MSIEDIDKMPEKHRKKLGDDLIGWSSWNPNSATCDVCGSSNVQFLWTYWGVKGFHCDDCGAEELDK